MLTRKLLSPALLVPLLLGQSAEPPVIPAEAVSISVPQVRGTRVQYHFIAVGKQIYQCENGQWSKSSTPDATLYDANSNLKVRHGTGPSWTTIDGRSTMKANGSTAIHFPAPDKTSIDWLKLDVDKSSRTGEFRGIDIVQRLYTGGGKAPNTGCTANQIYEAPYTAHYYFWGSGEPHPLNELRAKSL